MGAAAFSRRTGERLFRYGTLRQELPEPIKFGGPLLFGRRHLVGDGSAFSKRCRLRLRTLRDRQQFGGILLSGNLPRLERTG